MSLTEKEIQEIRERYNIVPVGKNGRLVREKPKRAWASPTGNRKYLKCGERFYEIITRNKIKGILTRYFGFVNLDDFIETMHGEIQFLDENN